jgi:CBS domain-containing protein
MQVRHILRDKGREVFTVASEATLFDAARQLTRRHIGALVIREADGSLGLLSERDIVRAAADTAGALDQPVSAHMTRVVETCTESDSIESLMEIMTHRRLRHLPVVEEGRLCGLVSIGDVVKSRIEETVREAESLREYIAAG